MLRSCRARPSRGVPRVAWSDGSCKWKKGHVYSNMLSSCRDSAGETKDAQLDNENRRSDGALCSTEAVLADDNSTQMDRTA